MNIEGKVQKVLICPYKEEMWCELELETKEREVYTVMIPTNVYNMTNEECLREGVYLHITGNVIKSSHFVIAWHLSLLNGVSQKLVLEH